MEQPSRQLTRPDLPSCPDAVTRPAVPHRLPPGAETLPDHPRSTAPGAETRPDHPRSTAPGAETRPDHPRSTAPGAETRPAVPRRLSVGAQPDPALPPGAARDLGPFDSAAAPGLIGGAPRVGPLRPRLVRISRAESLWHGLGGPALHRALESLSGRLAGALGQGLGTPCTADSVTLGFPGTPVAGAAFPFALGPVGSPCTLRISPELAAAAVSGITGAEVPTLSGPPDRITRAVLGHAVLVAFRAVAGAGLPTPVLAGGVPVEPAVTFGIRLRIGRITGALQIALDAATAEVFARSLGPGPAVPAPDFAAQQLTGALCAGPVRLRADTLRRLAPGDAVCFDPNLILGPEGPEGAAFLSFAHAGRVARGRLSARSLHIESVGPIHPTFIEEKTMSELQIDLRVVLADVPLTVGEAAGLAPGSVVTLPTTQPRARLFVGDTCLAVGELVDVDGVLGVRVLTRS